MCLISFLFTFTPLDIYASNSSSESTTLGFLFLIELFTTDPFLGGGKLFNVLTRLSRFFNVKCLDAFKYVSAGIYLIRPVVLSYKTSFTRYNFFLFKQSFKKTTSNSSSPSFISCSTLYFSA